MKYSSWQLFAFARRRPASQLSASTVRNTANWVNREDIGAGEGIRTLDPNLGKVVLYP